ncbi:MAG: UDP-N-acetylmuramate dehydrogenase [Betaproteobacteria bacterium]|nr:UDP-N-acetylmuramate dehydrogenase [Betaproteobacteria bacterium]
MPFVRPASLLSSLTTLRVGGQAVVEFRLDSEQELDTFSGQMRSLGLPVYVLGGGSNILAQDGELPLLLVRPNFRQPPEIWGEESGKVIVRAGAAVRLPHLLAKCAAWGLSGLEGLAGIPGTVGGAVAMNAGSYGCETASLLHSLQIWSPGTGLKNIFPEQWEFAYRYFRLTEIADCFFILSASFCLTRASSNGIRESMRLNYFKKKSTQPVLAWSAGCAFKNPSPELSAGKLLDEAGFRGKGLGGMVFSPVHANFLVNEGKGSASAAFELLAQAREVVERRNGVSLHLEIKVLPCF